MTMWRKVTFSSGHRYWFEAKTAEENSEIFGAMASPYNHGHNYVLSVEVSGGVDQINGMIVNIKVVDAVLKQGLLTQFHNRSINDEIPHFLTVAPCLENLLLYIRTEIDRIGLPEECTLSRLRLEEMPTLYAELMLPENLMTITRVYEFAASHRLHAPTLSSERNIELYGKCNNPAGHGHNYLLEVTVKGAPDEVTGMLTSIDALDSVVEKRILDRYDHRNLNEQISELQGKVTTSEVVSQAIFDQLHVALGSTLHSVRLHETARNIFEVTKPS